MKVISMKISEIKPYKNNPRNNEEAVEPTAKSIKEFGWQGNPIILDKNNVIIAGHTRYKAAKKLGMDEVPVVIASNLTPEQVKALRLADNKVGEIADWDDGLLDDELNDILDIDMSDFGFEEDEPEEKPEEVEPEVPFSTELLEENNYIVLKFDNKVDWLQAQTVFGLKTVKDAISKPSFKRKGIGRVIDGAEAINKIVSGSNEDFS